MKLILKFFKNELSILKAVSFIRKEDPQNQNYSMKRKFTTMF